jgi:hypothetical protein
MSERSERVEITTTALSGIDRLRRDMLAAGIPSEYAAIATGMAAGYASKAYTQGHGRGFNQGVEWQISRMRRDATVASPSTGLSAVVDMLQQLTDRTAMVLRGVAEQTELHGLVDEAREVLKANADLTGNQKPEKEVTNV